MTPQEVARTNQIYRAHLNTIYEIDYYHEKHAKLSGRSKHIDFLIALGAATSGGTGLGILANPEFAWLCGILTLISTIGAVAKGTYDWTGRLQRSIEFIEFFTPIKHGFDSLNEDINAAKAWDPSFEDRYVKLREKLSSVPIDSSTQLSMSERRDIQDKIKNRVGYQNWWSWQDARAASA